MTEPTPAAPSRPCFGCQTFDTAPRHEIVDPATGADVAGGPMHFDCCAELRECDVCALQLQRARDHAGAPVQNDELRAALVELPPIVIAHRDDDVFSVLTWAEVSEG